MSIGLIALLDDVAAMAKLAAASIDDVGAAAARASAKAAGVVIDDAAVTPRYVMGLKPERELPIIGKIAIGSLRNKLAFLLPAALLLSAFAPWALTPLLMAGGAYLCFEGAEKILEQWVPHQDYEDVGAAPLSDPAHLERSTVAVAVRTDFILSAEIMAIALTSVASEALWMQALILIAVSLLITAGVYGVVALIVKLDDIGLHLCQEGDDWLKPIGGLLVHAMPHLLTTLTIIGTVAMLWVGGGIFVHGLETLGVHVPGHQIAQIAQAAARTTEPLSQVLHWLVSATLFAVAGVIIGGIIVFFFALLHRVRHRRR